MDLVKIQDMTSTPFEQDYPGTAASSGNVALILPGEFWDPHCPAVSCC